MTRYKITTRIHSVDDDNPKPTRKGHEIIDTEADRMYHNAKTPKDIKDIYEVLHNMATRISEKEEIIGVVNVRKLDN